MHSLRFTLRVCLASSVPVHMHIMATKSSVLDLAVANAPTTILYLVGISIVYRISRAIYNISPFHPLYRFPGPKIAAVSYLYEAYYDWILKGRYGKVIAQMHKTYGKFYLARAVPTHFQFGPLLTTALCCRPHRQNQPR